MDPKKCPHTAFAVTANVQHGVMNKQRQWRLHVLGVTCQECGTDFIFGPRPTAFTTLTPDRKGLRWTLRPGTASAEPPYEPPGRARIGGGT